MPQTVFVISEKNWTKEHLPSSYLISMDVSFSTLNSIIILGSGGGFPELNSASLRREWILKVAWSQKVFLLWFHPQTNVQNQLFHLKGWTVIDSDFAILFEDWPKWKCLLRLRHLYQSIVNFSNNMNEQALF